MKVNWIYGLCALLLVAGLVVWRTYDRDTRRINQRLDRLAQVVEKRSGEGHLSTLAKSQELVNFFTPEATLHLSPVLPGVISRRDLSSLFYQVHSRLERLTFTLSDRTLHVDRAAGVATQRVTVRGSANLGGQTEWHVHEFSINWIKQDGEWFIERAEIVQAIRAPGSL